MKRGKCILPIPQGGYESNFGNQGQRNSYYVPHPKLDYPTFEGEEPREWMKKSEQYFRIYQIPEDQWVEIATMYFGGRAHRWKEGYLLDKPNINWEELTDGVCRRFDGALMKKLVRKFNKLVQTTTVEKYHEKFEELRARMIYLNPTLSEEYFIQSYISGLKEELIPFIDLSNPNTLQEVYEQARLHEQALAMMWRKHRLTSRPVSNQNTGVQYTRPSYQRVGSGQLEGNKLINRQLFEQRRAAGLCYKCGDKFQPGHQCQSKTLNQIGTELKVEEVFDESML